MSPTQAEIIQKTAAFVQQKFDTEATGHDWWHMYRVWKTAQHILKTEPKADPYVTELAALLHDIADWKFNDGDFEAGPKAAREWLESLKVDETTILHIEYITRHVSFKGAHVKSGLKTIEGYIVHDADKLDAIGAIGITRAFSYGGANNRTMHDPARKPTLHATFEAYKNDHGPTIGHFYEKLLLLKDRMFTKTGKKMAIARHKYMEKYLEEFYAEWDGEI
jgi:uncharacterized protein